MVDRSYRPSAHPLPRERMLPILGAWNARLLLSDPHQMIRKTTDETTQ